MEYDSVNRLIKYNGKEVRYDKDGNMTYGPLEGEMAAFTYDCRNRLKEVTTDSGDIKASQIKVQKIRNIKNYKRRRGEIIKYEVNYSNSLL